MNVPNIWRVTPEVWRTKIGSVHPIQLLLLLALVAIGWDVQEEPTLFLIGDSTMADKPMVGNPEPGWEQIFPILSEKRIRFENHAHDERLEEDRSLHNGSNRTGAGR